MRTILKLKYRSSSNPATKKLDNANEIALMADAKVSKDCGKIILTNKNGVKEIIGTWSRLKFDDGKYYYQYHLNENDMRNNKEQRYTKSYVCMDIRLNLLHQTRPTSSPYCSCINYVNKNK